MAPSLTVVLSLPCSLLPWACLVTVGMPAPNINRPSTCREQTARSTHACIVSHKLYICLAVSARRILSSSRPHRIWCLTGRCHPVAYSDSSGRCGGKQRASDYNSLLLNMWLKEESSPGSHARQYAGELAGQGGGKWRRWGGVLGDLILGPGTPFSTQSSSVLWWMRRCHRLMRDLKMLAVTSSVAAMVPDWSFTDSSRLERPILIAEVWINLMRGQRIASIYNLRSNGIQSYCCQPVPSPIAHDVVSRSAIVPTALPWAHGPAVPMLVHPVSRARNRPAAREAVGRRVLFGGSERGLPTAAVTSCTSACTGSASKS
jgi:hypothetical protein